VKKTLVTGPEQIKCSHCSATTEQSRDRARSDGWRIGWRPDHPTWCPDCFGAEVRRMKLKSTETYDEPMF
jgi:hypothetical protein